MITYFLCDNTQNPLNGDREFRGPIISTRHGGGPGGGGGGVSVGPPDQPTAHHQLQHSQLQQQQQQQQHVQLQQQHLNQQLQQQHQQQQIMQHQQQQQQLLHHHHVAAAAQHNNHHHIDYIKKQQNTDHLLMKESYNFGASPNLMQHHQQHAKPSNHHQPPSLQQQQHQQQHQQYQHHPHPPLPLPPPPSVHYGREQFNITENPNGGAGRDGYNIREHHQHQLHSHQFGQPQQQRSAAADSEPLLGVQQPVKIVSHPAKYEPPRYSSPSPSMMLQQQQHTQRSSNNSHNTNGSSIGHQQQLQHHHNHHHNHNHHQQPGPGPPSAAFTVKTAYMKPLPRLPHDIPEAEESRELSSTDDLSSRPRSPSVSSSDESYSKTTEGEADEENSPRPHAAHQQQRSNNHMHNINPLQWLYPCDIQVDPTSPKMSPIVDLAHMRAAFENASASADGGSSVHTTTSAGGGGGGGASTAATAANKGDSCNSFEYHDRMEATIATTTTTGGAAAATTTTAAVGKSPFEREIQRLLEASSSRSAAASAVALPPVPTTSATAQQQPLHINFPNQIKANLNNMPQMFDHAPMLPMMLSSANHNNNHRAMYELESVDKCGARGPMLMMQQPSGAPMLGGKHPVGLEAIKEITRNNTHHYAGGDVMQM